MSSRRNLGQKKRENKGEREGDAQGQPGSRHPARHGIGRTEWKKDPRQNMDEEKQVQLLQELARNKSKTRPSIHN